MAITRGINHIGLTVPDMEEATRFFKEGLEVRLLMIAKRRQKNRVVDGM